MIEVIAQAECRTDSLTYSYPVDIHNPDGVGVSLVPIQEPAYSIPYRCMATGQAAGVAAAHASQQGIHPRHLDVQGVQDNLLRQGAILSVAQARDLCRPATRATETDLADYVFHTQS